MLLEGASAKQQQQPLVAAGLTKLPRWKKVDPLLKSYLGNTLHLLGELASWVRSLARSVHNHTHIQVYLLHVVFLVGSPLV